jgi:SAM-dependent methyltransferase
MSGFAPDGSPVALYASLPPLGEAELIHGAIPAGAEILELGAGAGRVTHGLLALGHPVVAVDNSAEMLARIDGAETVLADMLTLDLGRRFPVVVLASNFINEPTPEERRAFLDVCARHVLADGQALLQGFPHDWEPSTEWTEVGPVRLRMRTFELDGDVVTGEMEYVVGAERLVHAFASKRLSHEELDADLESVGLRRVRELDDRGSWIEAAPLRS